MRLWMVAVLAGVAVTPAASQNGIDTSGNFRERLNSCVGAWKEAAPADRGTMTYRQYTQKCVSGKPALPVKASALCEDGEVTSGAAPGGACASRGGVAEW